MRESEDRSRFLTDSELRRLLEAAASRRHVHAPRDFALLSLLATTGIRPSEALALTTRDVHLGDAEPWISVMRLKTGRSAPVADELAVPAVLAVALRTHAETIAAGARLFPMHRRQAERLFHYYARQAAIPGRTWLYCLRHTAATRIYRVTRDIRTVQAALGHAHPNTSTLYAHVTRAMLREWARVQPVTV